MARQYIGPGVAFRVPEEIDAWVRDFSARTGVPIAEVYRELVQEGWSAELRRAARFAPAPGRAGRVAAAVAATA